MSEIEAVLAVLAVEEAKKRIDFPQRPGVTFYSELDGWIFQANQDSKTCDLCDHYDIDRDWRGDQLRLEFPYHEIADEDTILANVHPNCRCVLVRQI